MEGVRQGPLSGVTIVDLTRVLAGPYATMLLSELGARVIKIEQPGKGDDSRAFGPFVQGRPAYFGSINRNKESIALDLKLVEDRRIFEELLSHADVLTENFSPGVMEKLGYGWDELHRKYPKLIYAAISGFGHTGPSSNQPGYDMVMQGASGIMSITGDQDGGPCRVGVSIADCGSGIFAAVAINAALFHRAQTNETTKIDMAMFDCMLALMETPISRFTMTGEIATRRGTAHPGIAPFEAFKTKDGFLTIACGNDRTFLKFCGALSRPDLAVDPRFLDNSLRVANRPALQKEILSELSSETTSYWCAFFADHGVAAGPINDVSQALAHPQVNARQMLVEAIDPVLGPVKIVGSPFKLSAFADSSRRRVAPDLDQDRLRILKEFGIVDRARAADTGA